MPTWVKDNDVNHIDVEEKNTNDIFGGGGSGSGGSGSGALICHADSDGVLDKTVQEIYNALISGTPAYIIYQYGVLGTDYIGHLVLAPIVKIYNYNDTGLIRIIALKGYVQAVGSTPDLASPATFVFTAGGLNEYPTFLATVYEDKRYESLNAFVG